ncbi:MAG: isocitrate lyase and phosphorylmutase, partial [Chloroflexi bacterium]|nr:isocitrate lyase and phosphorylmutase [Chloroflexota bacterium]
MRPTTALRQLLKHEGIVLAPGVYDGLSARLVRAAGFAAAYATGGGIARSMGYPDLGLLSMREVTDRLALIVEHAGVPVIADADTGYGSALNVRRTVREFERAGVAALHLEDQTFPKRCGHYDDKALISTAEMSQKLRAARDAAEDPDLVLIARTDAIAVEGFDAAIERAHAYA